MNDQPILVTGFHSTLIETFRYWILSQFPHLHGVRTLLLKRGEPADVCNKHMYERSRVLHIHLVFYIEDVRATALLFNKNTLPETFLVVYHERLSPNLRRSECTERLQREVPSVSFEKCIEYLHSMLHKSCEVHGARGAVRFTARESEVLDLFAQGMSVKEVAYELSISPYTVAAHQRSLYLKTDSHTLQQLTLFAALRQKKMCTGAE